MTNLRNTLEGLQASGLVIQGLTVAQIEVLLVAQKPNTPSGSTLGHSIGKLAAKDKATTKDHIVRLFEQGRMFGAHLYQDQAQFDRVEFARKLGEVGFDGEQAQRIIANLRPNPTPELSSLGGRD